jgi:LysR family transcriptional activator of nhaA
MDWLNYHHLLYFFTVAKEGGLGPAGKVLRLSPSAISGQIKRPRGDARPPAVREARAPAPAHRDRAPGVPLRRGHLRPGHRADRARCGGHHTAGSHLTIGVADVVPKLLIKQLLDPALADGEVRLTCREDDFESLLGLLARHAVDVLITDAPVPPGSAVRAYNHLLGESTVTLLAPSRHAPSLRRGFPRSLDGAPLLLPLPGSVLRRDLDAFFAVHDVHPVIRAEAEDSALLKAFATEGMGALFVPTVIAKTVARQHDLTLGVRAADRARALLRDLG